MKESIKCHKCGKSFEKEAKEIKRQLKIGKKVFFCSLSCNGASQKRGQEITCQICGKLFYRTEYELKNNNNSFCSHSCNTTYQNAHKIKGNRRSKLELFLESQLSLLCPNLAILYNEKSTINSELDIFIPSLNLAFELNGIFHYEPIFGSDKLNSIQNNDNRKIQACLEKNIELCTIDVSSLKYFKPNNAQKYLDIITSIIDEKKLKAGEQCTTSCSPLL